jgi:hypothetical protein
MRRTDLAEATMEGWARLDAAERHRFFQAFLKAPLRLDKLAFRAWLRRRLREPPLVAIDPARFTISDADIAHLLDIRICAACQNSQVGMVLFIRKKQQLPIALTGYGLSDYAR